MASSSTARTTSWVAVAGDFAADGRGVTLAKSSTGTEQTILTPTSSESQAQVAVQRSQSSPDDVISLGSDGSHADSTNSLVQDFANLSVSGQQAVLNAAERIQTFRRLRRADQVNALRATGRLRRSAPGGSTVVGNGSGSAPAVNAIGNTTSANLATAAGSAVTLQRPRGRRMAPHMRGHAVVTPAPGDLEDWRLLCVVCGAQPASSIRDCVRAIKMRHCNIYDVTEGLDAGTVARSFPTASELATYTFRTNKVMPKIQARSKQMTKVLMKELEE